MTAAEIHDYCMARLGHEHMSVDSKEFSRPGRLLLAVPSSGVDPSGWETHGGWRVLFPPRKSLICPLYDIYLNNQTRGAKVISAISLPIVTPLV